MNIMRCRCSDISGIGIAALRNENEWKTRGNREIEADRGKHEM